MQIVKIAFVALVILGVSTSALSAQEPTCIACRSITVELGTTRAMLEFLKNTPDDDIQRKKVIDRLLEWIGESKEYDVGISIAASSHDVGKLLGKEGCTRLRAFLASSDAPSILNQALRSFHGEFAYSAVDRESMCAKILKGTDIEAVEGFEAGCRFGSYVDAVRARVLVSKTPGIIEKLDHSSFGKVFLTIEEIRSLRYSTR